MTASSRKIELRNIPIRSDKSTYNINITFTSGGGDELEKLSSTQFTIFCFWTLVLSKKQFYCGVYLQKKLLFL